MALACSYLHLNSLAGVLWGQKMPHLMRGQAGPEGTIYSREAPPERQVKERGSAQDTPLLLSVGAGACMPQELAHATLRFETKTGGS